MISIFLPVPGLLTPVMSYLGIFLAVFARQLCLPVPAVLFLITAGAAARGNLHVSYVLAAGVLGCLAGDGVWFWFGRRWGTRIVRLLCQVSSNPRACSKKVRRLFDKWGLRVLIIAKFIPGLDGVTPPLAGAEGARLGSFLLFDSLGALLWAGGYTTLGFLFADQLGIAMKTSESFASVLLAICGVPLLLYAGWRGAIIIRMMRHLHIHQMSPALLAQKMRDRARVAVIDLQEFEDVDNDAEGIPGSVRMEPERLRTDETVYIPPDIEIVLYCSSKREFVSARVASALLRRGISNVWVLEGGLALWREQGFPLTLLRSTREEAAARLGILLPTPRIGSTQKPA